MFSLDRNRYSLRVNGAGTRDRAMGGAALLNIKPHCFENAGLGFLDGIPQPVSSRKILTVGPILPAFTLHRNGISIRIHSEIIP